MRSFAVAFVGFWIVVLLPFTVCSQNAVDSSASRPAPQTMTERLPVTDTDDASAQFVHHEHFHYILDKPKQPSGELVVLLHGSGGDETTLVSFARKIWPRAALLGVRGRLVQNGETRWFRKLTPTTFDQNDVHKEADAFVRFLIRLGKNSNYELSQVTFVGYSNGANLLAVIMMDHPDLVRRAILMRSMPVLDDMPDGNLSKTQVLTIAGKKDVLYSPYAPTLAALLKQQGARVESYTVPGDHMIGDDDQKIIERWIGLQQSDRVSAAKPLTGQSRE